MTFDDIEKNFLIRRLSQDERISSFDCGDEDLNDFILNESALYRQALLAVSYVVEHRQTHQIIGYFSLANDKISLSDFDNKTEFNRFRRKKFVNEKRIKSYPAAKICRLAIDKSMAGKGIGSFILYFISNYFVFDNKTGCRFLTVDAYAKAIPFYTNNDFQFLNEADKDEHTRLLYLDLASLA
jgi:GNAT superfamily N-acetyltransferase